MMLGTLILVPPRRTASRVLAGLAVLALLGATGARDTVFDLNYPKGSMLAAFRELPPPNGIEYVTWDPIARIELSRIPPPDPSEIGYPSLIGDNPAFHQRLTRILTQNNFAFTFAVDYDGSRASLDGIEETIYAAAYQATSVERPKVAIVGVGGGIDVLAALYFDASEVTGVEINAATVELVTDTFRDDFKTLVRGPPGPPGGRRGALLPLHHRRAASTSCSSPAWTPTRAPPPWPTSSPRTTSTPARPGTPTWTA